MRVTGYLSHEEGLVQDIVTLLQHASSNEGDSFSALDEAASFRCFCPLDSVIG